MMSHHVQNFTSARRLEGWWHIRHHIPLLYTVLIQEETKWLIFSTVYGLPRITRAPFWSGVFVSLRLGTPLLGMLLSRKLMLGGGPEVCLVLRLHYTLASQTLWGSWWTQGQTGNVKLFRFDWTPDRNCTFFLLRSTVPCRSYTAHKLTKLWPSTTKRSRLMRKS